MTIVHLTVLLAQVMFLFLSPRVHAEYTLFNGDVSGLVSPPTMIRIHSEMKIMVSWIDETRMYNTSDSFAHHIPCADFQLESDCTYNITIRFMRIHTSCAGPAAEMEGSGSDFKGNISQLVDEFALLDASKEGYSYVMLVENGYFVEYFQFPATDGIDAYSLSYFQGLYNQTTSVNDNGRTLPAVLSPASSFPEANRTINGSCRDDIYPTNLLAGSCGGRFSYLGKNEYITSPNKKFRVGVSETCIFTTWTSVSAFQDVNDVITGSLFNSNLTSKACMVILQTDGNVVFYTLDQVTNTSKLGFPIYQHDEYISSSIVFPGFSFNDEGSLFAFDTQLGNM